MINEDSVIAPPPLMKEKILKKVNNCLNTSITFYLETSGGQKCNLHPNVVDISNVTEKYTSMAAQDSYFTAWVVFLMVIVST